MCGIVGIYGLEGIDDPIGAVNRMTHRMAHRGPDAEGTYLGSNVALGHRRLSIIDLSTAANQPWRSPDGRYALVYNGELYNYQTLRNQLPNYHFTTDSDTEVFLAALIHWGMPAFQKFQGMFAFAFWDQLEQKLWIGRDRLGIKPLYYAEVNQSVVFASELRAVLAARLFTPKLDQAALTDYLRYQTVHGPKTMVEGVNFLAPGTYLEISDSEVKSREYWMPWQSPHTDKDELVVQKQIRERLTTAVEDRLVADVPFGAFLSGGIDSSLIVGIISERLGRSIDTFNVSFDESSFSEAHHARAVAKKFGTAHHEIVLKPDAFLDSLPDALQAMDHPSGDGPNTWIVSRETKKQGISMALSGLGGDELFAGYEVFKRIPYVAERNWLLSFPKPLRSLVGSVLQLKNPGMSAAKTKEILQSDYFDLKHLYPIFRQVLLTKEVGALSTQKPLALNQVKSMIDALELYSDFASLPTLSRIGIAEMRTYMQHVLLRDTDQMSMAHALEVRVPFLDHRLVEYAMHTQPIDDRERAPLLDHRLVEYAMHIPDPLKFPHTPKQLLVNSFRDLLPPEVVNRPKMGFVLPWEDWMRNSLRSFCEERILLLASTSAINGKALEVLWSRFLANDPMVGWSRIWPLVTLADWMKNNDLA